MKASETIPEVPSNSALSPSLSICWRMRTRDRRQATEIDHIGVQRLGLGQLGREILLVRSHPEGAEHAAARRFQELAEVLVVTVAVIGGVVDDHPVLIAEPPS